MKQINRNTAAGKILAWFGPQPEGTWRSLSDITKRSGAPASSVSPRLNDLVKQGLMQSRTSLMGHLEFRLGNPDGFTLVNGPTRAPRIPGGKRAAAKAARTVAHIDVYEMSRAIDRYSTTPVAAATLADEAAQAIDEGKTPASFAPPKLVVSKFQRAIEKFAQDLAQFVVDEVEHEVVQRLTLLIPSIEQGVERKLHTTAVAPAKRRLPKVVIVGLLPQQAGVLATEFQELLDLSFWKDESPGKLKDMVKAAVWTLVHTGHVSHQTIELIKSCGKVPVLINGGMSQMRDRLLALSHSYAADV